MIDQTRISNDLDARPVDSFGVRVTLSLIVWAGALRASVGCGCWLYLAKIPTGKEVSALVSGGAPGVVVRRQGLEPRTR